MAPLFDLLIRYLDWYVKKLRCHTRYQQRLALFFESAQEFYFDTAD